MKIETENDVKTKIVKPWFDKLGAWSFAPVQTGMGQHGIPDRIGCVPVRVTPEMVGKTFGLFVAVEAKRPGRRGEVYNGCSKHQVRVLEEIGKAGGVARVCDCAADLETIEYCGFVYG